MLAPVRTRAGSSFHRFPGPPDRLTLASSTRYADCERTQVSGCLWGAMALPTSLHVPAPALCGVPGRRTPHLACARYLLLVAPTRVCRATAAPAGGAGAAACAAAAATSASALDVTAAVIEAEDFVLVDELQKMGINVADIAKLKAGGLHTVGQILATPSKTLLAVKGISDAKLEKVRACALGDSCALAADRRR